MLPGSTRCGGEDARLFENPGNLALTFKVAKGDAAAAFVETPHRREKFAVQRHPRCPWNRGGVTAEWEAAGGSLTVWGAPPTIWQLFERARQHQPPEHQ
jgi:hypothetical protein